MERNMEKSFCIALRVGERHFITEIASQQDQYILSAIDVLDTQQPTRQIFFQSLEEMKQVAESMLQIVNLAKE